MENNKEIGKLSLTIAPEVLREIVSSGRVLELAEKVSVLAADQIASQIVNQVASGALKDGLKSGAGVGVSFIFDGGDFATLPPRPHFGVVNLNAGAVSNALRRVSEGAISAGAGD